MAVEEAEGAAQKKRRMHGEDYEVGRLLGVIARKDEELMERIREYAEAQGKRATEVIYEALTIYDEYMMLKNVDIRSLMAALRLLNRLMKVVLDMMMAANQYVSSNLFAQQVEILHQLKQQEAAEKKSETEKRRSEVKEQLMNLVVSSVMNLVSSMMSMIMRPPGVQLPPPTAAPSLPAEKPKIVRGG